jgi:8-oxo-dGTP diphosphatase
VSEGFVIHGGRILWGRHGAAGVLFTAPKDGEAHYLLARRSRFVLHPGTWGLPGGALRHGEDPLDGALRETTEELGTLPQTWTLLRRHVATLGTWSYTTFVLELSRPFEPHRLSWETTATIWTTAARAPGLKLHPGLRRAWPNLTGG